MIVSLCFVLFFLKVVMENWFVIELSVVLLYVVGKICKCECWEIKCNFCCYCYFIGFEDGLMLGWELVYFLNEY